MTNSAPDAKVNGSEAAWREQLRAFIVGTDEFENRQGDPRVDYNRWNDLQDYYRRLDDGSPEKETIRRVIVDLFDDPAARYASLTLSRLLGFEELKTRIVSLVRSNEFAELPEHVRRAALQGAARFQMDEFSTCIVKTMTMREDLLRFLLWGTMPGRQIVTQNDHWRMNALWRYYSEDSDHEMRALIVKQLRGLAARFPEIQAIFRAFAHQHEDDADEFLEFLKGELDAAGKTAKEG
jgi:hypothetical protein